MSLVLSEYCDSSNHDTCNCPHHGCIDATCASIEKTINELIDKMIENMKVRIAEYSQCFNQSRENCNEPDSSLGSPKPEVSLYDDFEPLYSSRPNLNNDMPLPSVEQEGDFLTSLSQDLAPHTSSPTDITEDVLVSGDPPAHFHHSRDFEEGDDLESASDLNMSVIPQIEHRDFDESDDTIL